MGDVEDVRAAGAVDVRVFIRPRPAKRKENITALREAMDAAGTSYHRLAAASGVNHQTINNLARGRGGVERQKADAIAGALGVPTVLLFAHADGVPPA